MRRLRFPVRAETAAALYERMDRLGVSEDDLVESFIRCPGRGGQKLNKRSSGVRLRHRPTGVEVRFTGERSQGLNRFFARRLLIERLEADKEGDRAPSARRAARIRKQKRRRARRRSAPS